MPTFGTLTSRHTSSRKSCDHFCGIDIFIGNAAITKRRNVLGLSAAELDDIMRVNFLTPTHDDVAVTANAPARRRHGVHDWFRRRPN